MTKPDLQTILTRRRRSIEDFFRDAQKRGLSKEQVVAELEQNYGLSLGSMSILDKVFKEEIKEAGSKKVEVKHKHDKQDNKQEESKTESKEEEDNKVEVEEKVEQVEDTKEETPVSKKKSNKQSNKDSE